MAKENIKTEGRKLRKLRGSVILAFVNEEKIFFVDASKAKREKSK